MAENRGDGSRLANVACTVKVVTKRLGFGHLLLWLAAAIGRRLSTHIFVVTTHAINDGPEEPEERRTKNEERRTGDKSTADESGFESRLLTCQEVARFFNRAEGPRQSAFAAEALARGDRCFGLLKGSRLVWSCWYASGPAPVFDDVSAAADFPFLYAYNAYTDDAYRGRSLHPIGVDASARFFAREGYRAFTAYIEATNLPPLIAAQKMREPVVGFAVVRRKAGGVRWFATRGCRGRFRLVRKSECAEAQS